MSPFLRGSSPGPRQARGPSRPTVGPARLHAGTTPNRRRNEPVTTASGRLRARAETEPPVAARSAVFRTGDGSLTVLVEHVGGRNVEAPGSLARLDEPPAGET